MELLKEAYRRTFDRYQMCLKCIEDILEIAKEQDNYTVGKRIEQLLNDLGKDIDNV